MMLKRTITSCLSLALALLLYACATEPSPHNLPAADGHNTKRYSNIHDAFSMHDTNNDGYLDRQEFTQLQQDPEIIKLRKKIPEVRNMPFLFEEIDENGDDRISMQEMVIAIPRAPH